MNKWKLFGFIIADKVLVTSSKFFLDATLRLTFKGSVKILSCGYFRDNALEICRVCVQLDSPYFKYTMGEKIYLKVDWV